MLLDKSRDGQKIIWNKNFVHKFLFQIHFCPSLDKIYFRGCESNKVSGMLNSSKILLQAETGNET